MELELVVGNEVRRRKGVIGKIPGRGNCMGNHEKA